MRQKSSYIPIFFLALAAFAAWLVLDGHKQELRFIEARASASAGAADAAMKQANAYRVQAESARKLLAHPLVAKGVADAACEEALRGDAPADMLAAFAVCE